MIRIFGNTHIFKCEFLVLDHTEIPPLPSSLPSYLPHHGVASVHVVLPRWRFALWSSRSLWRIWRHLRHRQALLDGGNYHKNLKMGAPWKRRSLLETIIFRLHVSFWSRNIPTSAVLTKIYFERNIYKQTLLLMVQKSGKLTT